MSFKAATYNVLATAYVRPERYAEVPPELLRPERRTPALVRHVEGFNADLVCLQEVENDAFAALDRRLRPLGYGGCYEKRRGKPDGCATFFRKSVFALQQARRLDYTDGSGHIALLLALEQGARLLGVAGTHLRWDGPGTPVAEQVGRRQVVELLEACMRFTPKCTGWLVCGDFNCISDGEAAAAMRQAGYEHAHVGRPQARSCVANGRARLIDYLFHTGELRSRPLDPPSIEDGTALPSPEQPSDHLALLAEFDWARVPS